MFSEYITKPRVKEVNKMLALTDKSITDICFILYVCYLLFGFCEFLRNTVGEIPVRVLKMRLK